MRGVDGVLHEMAVVEARSQDKKVIREYPRLSAHRVHGNRPWAEDQCNAHHGKRASLGNATPTRVGGSQPVPYGVVHDRGFSKSHIWAQHISRHARNVSNAVEKWSHDLVEALRDVGATAREG